MASENRNNWNRVTPLSKFLAMALFIIFPFVGFYLGMQYQKMITPDLRFMEHTEPQHTKIMTPEPFQVEGSPCGGVAAKLCPLEYTCRLKTAAVNAEGTCVKDTGMDASASPANDDLVL